MLTVASPPVPSPLAAVNFNVKFSVPSTIASSLIVTVNVLGAASPIPQFKTCETVVKSVASAVPLLETTVTLAVAAVEPVRFTVIVTVDAFSATV